MIIKFSSQFPAQTSTPLQSFIAMEGIKFGNIRVQAEMYWKMNYNTPTGKTEGTVI